MKSREVYPKVEMFLLVMTSLLTAQTVSGNVASEEDPYIEGGKTIIVITESEFQFLRKPNTASSQKALTGIILQSNYFHGGKKLIFQLSCFLLQYESPSRCHIYHIFNEVIVY